MTVRNLNRKQLVEIKQNYLSQLEEEGILQEMIEEESLSYDVLSRADEIVPDNVIWEHYDGITFTEEDFFCSLKNGG